jgi:hypothetical protein
MSEKITAASVSLCFKDKAISGLILSSVAASIEDVNVDKKSGTITFTGYDSLDKQFDVERKVCFVGSKHPKFQDILAAARKSGIITNELKEA